MIYGLCTVLTFVGRCLATKVFTGGPWVIIIQWWKGSWANKSIVGPYLGCIRPCILCTSSKVLWLLQYILESLLRLTCIHVSRGWDRGLGSHIQYRWTILTNPPPFFCKLTECVFAYCRTISGTKFILMDDLLTVSDSPTHVTCQLLEKVWEVCTHILTKHTTLWVKSMVVLLSSAIYRSRSVRYVHTYIILYDAKLMSG